MGEKLKKDGRLETKSRRWEQKAGSRRKQD
jgi:hypothetical protein